MVRLAQAGSIGFLAAQSQQLASSIVTDQLVTALQKINAGYTAGAFVKGEINVKGSSSSGQSLMPEGLESGLSVQDMADLLSFIESL